jgi:hypothetical protein
MVCFTSFRDRSPSRVAGRGSLIREELLRRCCNRRSVRWKGLLLFAADGILNSNLPPHNTRRCWSKNGPQFRPLLTFGAQHITKFFFFKKIWKNFWKLKIKCSNSIFRIVFLSKLKEIIFWWHCFQFLLKGVFEKLWTFNYFYEFSQTVSNLRVEYGVKIPLPYF